MVDKILNPAEKQLVAGLFIQAAAEVNKIADSTQKQAGLDAIKSIRGILSDDKITGAELPALQAAAKKIPGAESLNGWIDQPADATEQQKLKNAKLNPADPMQGFMMMIFSFIAQALGLDPKVFGLDQTAAPAAAPTAGAGTATTTAPVVEQGELAKLGINTNPTTSTEAEKQRVKATDKLTELEGNIATLEKTKNETSEKFNESLQKTKGSLPKTFNRDPGGYAGTAQPYMDAITAAAKTKAEHDWIKAAYDKNKGNSFADDHTSVTDSEGKTYTLMINTGDAWWGTGKDNGKTGVNRERVRALNTQVEALEKTQETAKKEFITEVDNHINLFVKKGSGIAAEEFQIKLTPELISEYAKDPKRLQDEKNAANAGVQQKKAELENYKDKLFGADGVLAKKEDLYRKIGEFTGQQELAKEIQKGKNYGDSGIFTNYSVHPLNDLIDEKNQQIKNATKELEKIEKQEKELLKNVQESATSLGVEQQKLGNLNSIEKLAKDYVPMQQAEDKFSKAQENIDILEKFLKSLTITFNELKNQEKEAAEKAAKEKKFQELKELMGGGESVSNAPSNNSASSTSYNNSTQYGDASSSSPQNKAPSELEKLAKENGIPVDTLKGNKRLMTALKDKDKALQSIDEAEKQLEIIGVHREAAEKTGRRLESGSMPAAPIDDNRVTPAINASRLDIRNQQIQADDAAARLSNARTHERLEKTLGNTLTDINVQLGKVDRAEEIIKLEITIMRKQELDSQLFQLEKNSTAINASKESLIQLMDKIQEALNKNKSADEIVESYNQLKSQAGGKNLAGLEKEIAGLGRALLGAANPESEQDNALSKQEHSRLVAKVDDARKALESDASDLAEKLKDLNDQLTPKGKQKTAQHTR